MSRLEFNLKLTRMAGYRCTISQDKSALSFACRGRRSPYFRVSPCLQNEIPSILEHMNRLGLCYSRLGTSITYLWSSPKRRWNATPVVLRKAFLDLLNCRSSSSPNSSCPSPDVSNRKSQKMTSGQSMPLRGGLPT